MYHLTILVYKWNTTAEVSMQKNIFLKTLITLILIMATGSYNLYATNVTIDDTIHDSSVQILIDQSPIVFKTSPKIINNNIMVPMSEFFSAMGADVIWIEEQRIVVAYKDNMHLKLYIDSNKAYENGHEFTLPQKPISIDGHIFLPIEIVSKIFNMHPKMDTENNTLNLDNFSNDAGLKTFGRDIYKTHTIKPLGIAISMPYHWNKLSDNFSYGIENEYTLKISTKPLNIENSDEDIFKDAEISLNNQFENRIEILNSIKYKIHNSITVQKILFDTWDEPLIPMPIDTPNEPVVSTPTDTPILPFDIIDESVLTENFHTEILATNVNNTEEIDLQPNKKTNLLYVLKTSDQLFYILCSQGEILDLYESESSFEDIFDNIISTFIVRNESIDVQKEHYVEFKPFYQYGMRLSKHYHSNMVIGNSKLNFSGKFVENHNFTHLNAIVSHDDEQISFHLPINDNAFDKIIPLPFGLGQHNIKIFGVQKQIENNPSPTKIPLLQFSVINIDRNKTRYLIPTSKIQNDDPQIKSVSHLITYQSKNKYIEAYTLFGWITHNMKLIDHQEVNTNLTNYEIFENRKGTPEQINQLLTAMFRSINIPSRVVSGYNKNQHIHYWTEILINGQWMATNPIDDILYFTRSHYAPPNSKFIKVDKFRQLYTNIHIENY